MKSYRGVFDIKSSLNPIFELFCTVGCENLGKVSYLILLRELFTLKICFSPLSWLGISKSPIPIR